jgi:sortase A
MMLCGTSLIALSLVYVLVDSKIVSNAMYAMTQEELAANTPEHKMLHLTVPRMKRVNDIPVFTAASDDVEKLDAGAIHVEGTGFPWEREANVYIAGHRLGYPRTGSFLVFYDLNKLRNGDKVVLEDAEGGRYIYTVFEEMIVNPGQTAVTKPIDGKNIVSLQACTLPDYTRRLVVRAELERYEEAPPKQASSPAGESAREGFLGL